MWLENSSGTSSLKPNFCISLFRMDRFVRYLKLLAVKLDRFCLLKLLKSTLITVYANSSDLSHLPSTPPSLQNSSRACLNARIAWVGGVNRNWPVLSSTSAWSNRSRLRLRQLPKTLTSLNDNLQNEVVTKPALGDCDCIFLPETNSKIAFVHLLVTCLNEIIYVKKIRFWAAAIAPWYRLRLQFWGRWFESHAHHLCFLQFVLKL